MARQDHAALFVSARVALVNGRDLPDVQRYLAEYGYTPARLNEGIALLDTAELADSEQGMEYGEREASTAALAEVLGAFRAAYVRHVTLARAAFKPGTEGHATLGLGGDRENGLAELLAQARQFYRGIQRNAAFQAALTPLNLTAAAVTAALAAAEDVEAARATQAKEYGEAQVATRVRDDHVAALRGYLKDYYAVARVALADEPQLRETLGLREPGSF